MLSGARAGFLTAMLSGAKSKHPEDACCNIRHQGVRTRQHGKNALRRHGNGDCVGIFRLRAPGAPLKMTVGICVLIVAICVLE